MALVTVAAGCTTWPKPDAARALPESTGTPRSAKPVSPAKLEPAADAISLSTKATPSAGLYMAMGRLAEQSGKVADAEVHYQRALKIDAQNANALVSYARLKDRQGRMAEATGLYRRAVKADPRNASIHNDLGLCLARQKKFEESKAALEQAIQLEPQKWLYRNNLAMVLVETDQVDAAISHLAAVQDEAVAHYNVGYILQKKGNSRAAAEHFAKALEKNSKLVEARIWLDKLGHEPVSVARVSPPAAVRKQADRGAAISPQKPVPSQPQRDASRAVATRVAPQPPAVVQSLPAPKIGSRASASSIPESLPPAPLPLPEPKPTGKPASAPGYANVAPLPPATSLDQAPEPGESMGTESSRVRPLPPVTP